MKNHQRFKEKYGPWALVTGASSGIGKALVHELAANGLDIIGVGRNIENLRSLKEEISNSYQRRLEILHADLSSPEGIRITVNESGKYEIGLFVQAAGMESHGSFTQNTIEDESKLISLNIQSTLQLSHHFAQVMSSRSKGGILLVSSLTGHMASPYFSNYAATKSYILNLGLSLNAELQGQGVDVSVLSPGLTKTAMAENMAKDIDWSKTPMKFMNTREVAKEAIAQFGKKASIIPGASNKITAFIAKRVIPEKFGKNSAKMMEKAFINLKS